MDKIMNMIQGKPPPPENSLQAVLRQVDDATTLSWKHRAMGFGVCFGIGMVLNIVSLFFLSSLQLVSFAVIYSVGNILSIMSTMFLMGPCKQVQRMMEQNRIIFTVFFLGMIVATLVVAFKTHSFIFTIICLIIQVIAFLAYCITWIPGGTTFLKAMIMRG